MKNSIYAEELKCEDLSSPLAIDIKRPRFSWICATNNPATARNKKQTAYRILIAASEKDLLQNKGAIWDSGIISTDTNTAIQYAGKALISFKKYYWKVMLWDEKNKPGKWSTTAEFSTGAMKPNNWKGEWLRASCVNRTLDLRSNRFGGNPVIHYRKKFTIDKPVIRAILHISALGVFEPYINGKRIGNDYLAPGWTDYKKHVYYYSYDITGNVKKGNNAIGCMLADGWYAGYFGWNKQKAHYGNNPFITAQLIMDFADGKREIIATDRTWKVSGGPLIEADLMYGEVYDARKEIPDWSKPEYNDDK